MLHQMQGAYYVKGFAKHGPLHNPHTYGYFDHVPYKGFKGGHVTCGGIVYQADAYPKEFRDQYIAGNLLSNAVYWHKLTPKGSSFIAEHGGDLLVVERHVVPAGGLLPGPGRERVRRRLVRQAGRPPRPDRQLGQDQRPHLPDRVQGEPKQPEPFDLRKKTIRRAGRVAEAPEQVVAERGAAAAGGAAGQERCATASKRQVLEEKGLLALESLWALYSVEGAG